MSELCAAHRLEASVLPDCLCPICEVVNDLEYRVDELEEALEYVVERLRAGKKVSRRRIEEAL